MSTQLSRSAIAFRDAFLELVKKMPIEKITVAAIVDRSGYSKGAFYKQYESKDLFLKSIVDNEIEVYTSISRNTYKELGGYVFPTHDLPPVSLERLFEHVYQNRELYRFIFSNYSYFNTVDYFFRETYAVAPCYKVDFSDDYPDIEPELYLYLSMYVQKAVIKYSIDHDFDKSPVYMATQCALFTRKKAKKYTLVDK